MPDTVLSAKNIISRDPRPGVAFSLTEETSITQISMGKCVIANSGEGSEVQEYRQGVMKE